MYVDELQASAEGIAARAGLDAGTWSIGWQSASTTPEPWRGPDIGDVIERLASDGTSTACWSVRRGSPRIISRCCTTSTSSPPTGAATSGSRFARTAMLNDDAEVLTALAGRSASVDGMKRVAVVGGGITGLAAAYELRRRLPDVDDRRPRGV